MTTKTDLISREAAKAAIECKINNCTSLLTGPIEHPWTVTNSIRKRREGLREALAALDALPAADAGNLLAPEPLKAALRESLQGCGPMAVVYAEATVNAMAGIETPERSRDE